MIETSDIKLNGKLELTMLFRKSLYILLYLNNLQVRNRVADLKTRQESNLNERRMRYSNLVYRSLFKIEDTVRRRG